jgi:hypothetical protein
MHLAPMAPMHIIAQVRALINDEPFELLKESKEMSKRSKRSKQSLPHCLGCVGSAAAAAAAQRAHAVNGVCRSAAVHSHSVGYRSARGQGAAAPQTRPASASR